MVRPSVLLLLSFTVALGLLARSSLAADDCKLSNPEMAKVVNALDGETLILEDGREMKLIGAKSVPPFRSREGDDRRRGREDSERRASLADTARDALDAMVAGQTVELRYGGARADRHGRVLAQAYVTRDGERIWLQGAMIGLGHARAYSFADNQACVAALLAREAGARERRLGLWASRSFRIRQADEIDDLLRARQSFQIVEGTVLDVGRGRGRLYLNFGQDWRSDFTVSIPTRQAKRFAKAGIDPASMKGARIRVRGWIEPRNGPAIEVTHPAEIEILAPAPKQNPASEGPPGSRDI